MDIKFYSGFSKRINSTKRPSGTAQLSLDGDLRDSTSVTKPVIKIKNLGATSPTSYVYAYIPKFNRYYFVSDWTYDKGFWWVSLTEDCLATWKTNIGNTNAYINRCSSQFDGTVIDTVYPTTTEYSTVRTLMTSDYYKPLTGLNDGCFILGVISGASASSSQMGGAVTYYALTPTECRNLISYLLSDNFLSDSGFGQTASLTQQINNDTAKAFVKPIDYIASCMWYPFSVTDFASGNSEYISVGYWLVGQSIATGKIVNQTHIQKSADCTLPDHPQASTRGSYLNFSPYSKYSIHVPPFGTLPIDPLYRTQGTHLHCQITIDSLTGIAQMFVYLNDGSQLAPQTDRIVAEASAQIGVPIQISQINADFFHAGIETIQAGVSAVGVGLSAMSLNASGAAEQAGQSIAHMANAVDYVMPQIRSTGTDGSRIGVFIEPRMTSVFMTLVDEDNEELGRPLLEKRVINTLSGFVSCFEVTVDYPCYDYEKTVIHNFLTSGFFWE